MILWNAKERCIDWMGEWLGEKFAPDPHRQAIGYERDGKLIASVSYEKFTGHDVEMGLLIAERVPKGFVRAAFRYPFEQLKCPRVSAEVKRTNDKMLALMQRLGFTQEGIKRGLNKNEDYIVFGMLRTECRYL